MAGIRLEFAQFGHFTSFDVIRSMVSMDSVADADLPTPIATGLKTMYYVDSNVVRGLTYYYRVRVWRGSESFVSDEIVCVTAVLWSPENLVAKIHLRDRVSNVSGGLQWLNNGHADYNFTSQGIVTPSGTSGVDIALGNNYLYSGNTNAKRIFSGIGKAWVLCVFSATAGDVTLFMVTDTSTTTWNGRLVILTTQEGKISTFVSRNSFSGNDPFPSQKTVTDGDLHIVILEQDWEEGQARWYIDGVLDSSRTYTDKGLTNTDTANNNVHVGKYATAGTNNGAHTQKMLAVNTGAFLTISERQKLEGWVAHEYGITANLPSSHPFKSRKPFTDD